MVIEMDDLATQMSMGNLGDAAMEALRTMGNVEHVAAAEGDFIDEDNYLCCGVCKKRKEFRRQFPFRETPFVVPALCDCGLAERARFEEEERQREERRRLDELASFSLIDSRFRESLFANFVETEHNTRALRIARNYVQNFDLMCNRNKGLILYGPTSTGKTYLAACIANELMGKGVPTLVTSIVALTRNNGEDLPKILRLMNNAKLLILDDYGAERFTEFKSEQIFDLIDTRYGSKKPMIITTNIPLTDLKKETDIRRKRVNTRILEVCHPVKMDGESWRERLTREQYDSTVSLLEAE